MQPDYYHSPFRRHTILKPILVLVGVIILFVVIISVSYASRAGKHKLKIQFAPSYAEIKINDKKYRNNSDVYLTPGEYTVSVNAPEFEPTSYKFTVDDTTEYIYDSLNPATALGNELMNNQLADEFLAIEGISGGIIGAEGERLLEEYPILTSLPYQETSKNGNIVLGYLLDNYTLTISVENFYEPESISFFLNLGIEKFLSLATESGKPLAEYAVEIEDFTNPFAKIKPNSASDPQSFLETAISELSFDPSVKITYGEGTRQNNIYYTTFSWYDQINYIPIVYRVALIQDGDSWRFAGPPYPIATTTNMPNVPTDILNTLNNIPTGNAEIEGTEEGEEAETGEEGQEEES